MRFLRFRLALAFIAGIGLVSMAADSTSGTPFSKGPYIQIPAPGVASIMWESSANAPAVVHWGPNDSLVHNSGPVVPQLIRGASSSGSGTNKVTVTNIFYLYKASIPNLEHGAHYSYSVETRGTRTPAVCFKTLDPRSEETQFVVYGDSRSDPVKHRAVASRFLENAPDFILHTGDLVASGENYSLWSREFFEPMADVIDRVPFFSVIGNHEQNGTNYLNYFDLPGKELWYSFDAGPVHVLALDFRFEQASHEQFKFARRDLLSSRAPWKIVFLHVPVYNVGGHASTWGHAAYVPLFYKAQVDLVIGGHSHLYERFRPLTTDSKKDWAITPITTGGGGASLYSSLDHPALLSRETINHFMVFDVTREQLRAKALRVDGSVIDTFEVSKPHGKFPQDYFSQAFPRESLDPFFQLAPGLTGNAAALPTTNSAALVMLRILPLNNARFSEEVKITLNPDSAKAYELLDAPVRARTPGLGQTNVLWVKVLAREGVAPTGNKDQAIRPPLMFQATLKTSGPEIMSCGRSTVLSSTASKAAGLTVPKVGTVR